MLSTCTRITPKYGLWADSRTCRVADVFRHVAIRIAAVSNAYIAVAIAMTALEFCGFDSQSKSYFFPHRALATCKANRERSGMVPSVCQEQDDLNSERFQSDSAIEAQRESNFAAGEIAAIEAQILAGNPGHRRAVSPFADWNAELRLLRKGEA
jgi:hypothetical protein